MYGVYTADQVRTAEGVMLGTVADGVLMRRAAAGLAREVRAFLGSTYGRRVVLLVGAGDNGGDALWAGVELRRRGAHVTALLLSPDRAHRAGLAALRAARGRVLPVDADALDPARAAVRAADVVVDGIVGISGRPGLRAPAPALVTAADEAGVPIVACDLPSGVDADTGRTDGPHVRAALTVTFGCRKPVHALAAPVCGPVRLVDFGLGPFLDEHVPDPHAHLLDDADVGVLWPVPGPADDKYSQGVVGIAAGSATYPGAAVLAAGAAALSTSGMVRFAGSAADEVRRHWPEIVATGSVADAGRTQAWAVGPGIGTGDAGRALFEAVLDLDVPLCVDADAITLLAKHRDLRDRIHGRPVVLTPHAGEFARIAGDVGTDRVAA
ncbi:MAG: NAD(P)H-hydrate epimerase, partial [Pseudonocardia sediminis]